MNIKIISASKNTTFNWCPIWPNNPDNVIATHLIENNTDSLAAVYNQSVEASLELDKRYGRQTDWFVFVHADVDFHLPGLISRLETYKDQYDVVGVAGTNQLKIEAPCLWHLMGGGFNGGHLHGAVAHKLEDGRNIMTSFGPYPEQVLVVDGLFIAVRGHVFTEHKVRFDEKCPSKFHYYDLNLCLDCTKKKLKIGVVDIAVTHDSPGLRELTSEFLRGQEYFLEKYADWSGKTIAV